MIDTETTLVTKHNANEQHIILQEYDQIVSNLKKGLSTCEGEQDIIRLEVEKLQNDNKKSSEIIRDYLSEIHKEHCNGNNFLEKDTIKNLQERIVLMQVENDSMFQLWQMSLKSVTSLEDELKILRSDGKGIKYCEEQINSVRETYSEAIKTLENKLLEAKENFIKQRSLYEFNKEIIENLRKEKEDIMLKLSQQQNINVEKDHMMTQKIESLKSELSLAKAEIYKVVSQKNELEEKLKEAKKISANLLSKDEETKSKMSEAIELVESAVREKDLVLQRESQILEQKKNLEHQLAILSDEFTKKLQTELSKANEIHESSIRKYAFEIKELKTDLRQKITMLDRAERERHMAEEEIHKVRYESDNSISRLNNMISELQGKLKNVDYQMRNNDNMFIDKRNMEIKQLKTKIDELTEKLDISNAKLHQIKHQCYINNTDHEININSGRNQEINERYVNLEKRLLKTLNDKENLEAELRLLQCSFDKEIQKRDHERYLLENKIHTLETNSLKGNQFFDKAATGNLSNTSLHNLEHELKMKYSLECLNHNRHCESTMHEHITKMQGKFDKRVKELTQHVAIHQKLSKKCRDEAKTLTTKFQVKCKEMRNRINVLRKENEELNKELSACRQQLTQYRVQVIHRSNNEETR